MPEYFGTYEGMQVNEYMEFYSALYGGAYPIKKYWLELLELVNLSDEVDSLVSTLSRSKKQCLGIARCLIHNPVLLILDEPFRDLDPIGVAQIMGIFQKLKKMGKTILFSSSVLTGLERTCTYIGIMKNGTMEIEGTIDSVLTRIKDSGPILIQTLENPKKAIPVLRANDHVVRVSSYENMLYIEFNGTQEQEAELLQSLIEEEVSVVSFSRTKGNLENLVYELSEGTERRKEHYEVKSSLFKRFKIKR